MIQVFFVLFTISAFADRFVPTWSVYYEKNGEGFNQRIDEKAFTIPKTNCVVQEANAIEGEQSFFARTIKCMNGNEYKLECDASKADLRKQCHVVADEFSFNLSVKRLRHLGGKKEDTVEQVIFGKQSGQPSNDNNGIFRYHPSWSITYKQEKYGRTDYVLEKFNHLTYEIPGTDCKINEPNVEMGEEPHFIRTVTCRSGKKYVIDCNAYGNTETHCFVDGEGFHLSLLVKRHRRLQDMRKIEADFERNHKGTY